MAPLKKFFSWLLGACVPAFVAIGLGAFCKIIWNMFLLGWRFIP